MTVTEIILYLNIFYIKYLSQIMPAILKIVRWRDIILKIILQETIIEISQPT